MTDPTREAEVRAADQAKRREVEHMGYVDARGPLLTPAAEAVLALLDEKRAEWAGLSPPKQAGEAYIALACARLEEAAARLMDALAKMGTSGV